MISLESIRLLELSCRVTNLSGMQKVPQEGVLEFRAEKDLDKEGRRAQLKLTVSLQEDKNPEWPYEISVTLLGVFRIEGEEQPKGVQRFLDREAQAILTPFLREILADVSRRTGFPGLELPLVERQMMQAEGYAGQQTEPRAEK